MLESIHILLVEDNPGDVRLLREHLHQESNLDAQFKVTHVERLGRAIEVASQGGVDVILLDLSLPDALGIETCRRLLADCEPCPPVIVLTGLTDRSVATEAVASGAQDFLVKGAVDHEALVRSIRYAIERNRARIELSDALEREQGMVEQLQELDRLKNRFVAMASHELRTPLASISGFASTLSMRWTDIADDDRRKYIGIIDQQGQRLSRLVDDLLVLSRIESGALDARPEPVDLDRAIKLVLAELDMHEPQMTVDVSASLRVMADRDHLDQMLINYVSNAIKYGEAPFRVESRVSAGVGGFVDVIVRDSGDGVPDDVAPILFEEFARGRGHTEARIEGTGLGLSIVRGLARAQGGEAWYEPNEPKGAAFGLRLPVEAPPAT